MTKRNYTYTILRYIHDPLSAEFVNVGVVLYCEPASGQKAILTSKTRRTIGRLREMFPDLDRPAFVSSMQTIDKVLSKVSREFRQDELSLRKLDALSYAKEVLPFDDSGLQWSPLGSGITASVSDTLEKLFSRYVTRYELKSKSRRTDEEVWRPVRQLLTDRKIPVELEKKVIVGGDDQVEFQHAWKNGAWHMYEPLSLDLADADGIYRKAHRWLGQLTSVVPDAKETIHTHFIVGAPSDPSLGKAYSNALKILSKAPGDVEIFEENDIDSLINKIEDEVRAHGHAAV